MKIDAPPPRMVHYALGDLLAKRDYHHHIGWRKCQRIDIGGTHHLQPASKRRRSNRRRRQHLSTAGGSIGLADHLYDRVPGIEQRAERWHAKLTAGSEDDSKREHGIA